MYNNVELNKQSLEIKDEVANLDSEYSVFRRIYCRNWGNNTKEFISVCKRYKRKKEVLGYDSKNHFCVLNTGEIVQFTENSSVMTYEKLTECKRAHNIKRILNGSCGKKAKKAFVDWYEKRPRLGKIESFGNKAGI